MNRSGLGEDEPETENFHVVDINLENVDPRQVEQAELTEDSLNVTEKKWNTGGCLLKISTHYQKWPQITKQRNKDSQPAMVLTSI